MPKTFTIRAGATALNHIKKNGLSPDDISVIPAAAGGPKWIALHAFDQYLLSNWFQGREKPLNLVGASAGAWRMLCYTLPDASAALDRFLKSYAEQSYDVFPTADELSEQFKEIMTSILGENGKEHLLKENLRKLYIISTQTHFPTKENSKYRASFLKFALKNGISRKLLKSDIKRVVFTNSNNHQLIQKDGFDTNYFSFTKENTVSALRSTGTLPLLMSPVDDVAGVSGLLWDGALVDYHIGLNYQTDGLILYPHFSEQLIEGWFDKFLPWRKFNGAVLDKMIMISPSKEFVKSLPDSKIPDRKDFEIYMKDNLKRIRNWYEVANRGKEMAEEFDDYWKSGKLAEVIQGF